MLPPKARRITLFVTVPAGMARHSSFSWGVERVGLPSSSKKLIHLWLRLARDTRAITAVEAAVPAATSSQATRLPLQSRAINYNDFALVWPVTRTFHKARAHGILADVIPFLGVTFVAAQNVIKKSRLPKTRQF